MPSALRIQQISTADLAGGAEKIAWNLHHRYRELGHDSWLMVGDRRTIDVAQVVALPNEKERGRWARFWRHTGDRLAPLEGRLPGAGRVRGILSQRIGQPARFWKRWRGQEDFDFPASWRLLDLTPRPPDIVHCHNLHGGYFDLRALPWLSNRTPTLVTLHDAWLLTGHCAHSFDCERWRTGCGSCPDLSIPPAIQRDATGYNWRRKRGIYARSRLHVATPCHWLMRKVEQSILAPAVAERRVIPNGVDLEIFRPAGRGEARAKLGIPQETRVFLFVANGIRDNVWKDFATMRAAVARIAETLHGETTLFLALGENSPPEQCGRATVQFVPHCRDERSVAGYYQAADTYLHAARADTFPTTILEALACGTPVVASAVGGIPEQVREGVSGFCVPVGDCEAMAARAVQLVKSESVRRRFGEDAARDAARRFGLRRMAQNYLDWYGELRQCRTNPAAARVPAGERARLP